MIPSLYLRLSVTDQCNLRCAYCRPARAGQPSRQDRDAGRLSREHIVRASVLANEVLPLRKLRFTGGEPLLREDLTEIVADAHNALPETKLALTTNGVRLAQLAAPLHRAGLDALNISLDTLDPERFRALTGAHALDRVLDGIAAARKAGFDPIKLNAVLLRHVNGDQLADLVRLASRFGAELRFIELMPNGAGAALHPSAYLSAQQALEDLKTHFRYEGALGRTGTASRQPLLRRRPYRGGRLHHAGLAPLLRRLRPPPPRCPRQALRLPTQRAPSLAGSSLERRRRRASTASLSCHARPQVWTGETLDETPHGRHRRLIPKATSWSA